jgi:hypothetical protein
VVADDASMRKLSSKMVDAVIANDVKAVAKLLAARQNVNARNENGETAFSYACANNAFEVAQLLHLRGADINTIDKGNGSPLDWADCWSSRKFCRWLESVGGKRHDVAVRKKTAKRKAPHNQPLQRTGRASRSS